MTSYFEAQENRLKKRKAKEKYQEENPNWE